MTLGNSEIQKYIEMGSRSVNTWETKINGKKIKLKWRPLMEWESSEVIAAGFDVVSEKTREWLLAEDIERKKIEKKRKRPTRKEVRLFNREYAKCAILMSLQDFYPEMTREQLDKLDINFIRFHRLISTASGDTDGQKTVDSFPVNK